jgi:sugar phosphate isomerase/epimerase
MKVCLNRSTLGRGLPFDRFLSLAADAGFPGADVDLEYAVSHGTSTLRDLYNSRKMQFGGWGVPFDWRGDQSVHDDGMSRFAQRVQIAAELGIDACATYLLPSSDLPFRENWKFHIDRLGAIARILADRGVRLGLEFVAPYHLRRWKKHEFIFTPGAVLELAADIGTNVGLLIDTYHIHCAGEPLTFLSALPKESIVLVHLSDAAPGAIHELHDAKRLIPGDGVIDLAGFLKALNATGYDGPVSVEILNPEISSGPAAQVARKVWLGTSRVITGAGF